MRAIGRLLSGSFRRIFGVIRFLVLTLGVLWASLAIYYSNLPWSLVRLGLAAIFAALSVWGLWFSRRRSMPFVVIALFLGVVGWWISIAPLHDRNWRPEVAVMPRAVIDGDRVRLTGVRNSDYRSQNDFTVHAAY